MAPALALVPRWAEGGSSFRREYYLLTLLLVVLGLLFLNHSRGP
jgi:hypothetical protein